MARERDYRPRGDGDDRDDDWSDRVSHALTGRGHEPAPPKRKKRRYGRRLAVFAAVLLACGGAAFGVGSYLLPPERAEADAGRGQAAQAMGEAGPAAEALAEAGPVAASEAEPLIPPTPDEPVQMAQAAEDPESPPVPKPSPAQKPAASATAGTQKFGNWILLCQDAAQMTRKTCFVAQQIAEELSKQVVFAWRLQYDDQGNLASIFRTPTGVFVNRGIVLKLGDATEGLKVGYQLCDERKCQAIANVPAEVLKSLSAAKTVSAALALTSGKTANVNINMAGFPAAMAALAKLK